MVAPPRGPHVFEILMRPMLLSLLSQMVQMTEFVVLP